MILKNELCSRQKKLNKLRDKGISFPNNFKRNAISNQLHLLYDKKTNKEINTLNIKVSIAGRIITHRVIGRVSFITLQDYGGKIQLYIVKDNLPEKQYNEQFKNCDLGDILGVHGKLFKTNTGELTVRCIEIYLLTKSIRPFPDKFHGVHNYEIRYRQRYLDLIANDKSRKIFKTRSLFMSEIRSFMIKNDFIEVETPMIQMIPGAASARPFITHYNALNIDMYLRVAPEIYLKQLIIGGFEKIFEINRSFRNEGLSPYHNPEFTMMELYIAYADYNDLIILIEDLFKTLTNRLFRNNVIHYGSEIFDFSKPFIKMTMIDSICYFYPKFSQEKLNNLDSATKIAKSINIKTNKLWGLGRIQSEIFEKIVKNNLIQPTFITSYPKEISPLARSNKKNPFFTDRFELFINGTEIANGFSELNDPEEQSLRFKEQIKYKDSSVKNEIVFYDEDYITALEYGLPPTAGLGIGIDRLIMILTDSHTIRDVILFPMLRPKKNK